MIFVEFFTMPGCRNCVSVRALLNEMHSQYEGFSYEEIDLSKHPHEATRYNIMACPAIAINSKLMFLGGVDEKKLRRAFDDIAKLTPRP